MAVLSAMTTEEKLSERVKGWRVIDQRIDGSEILQGQGPISDAAPETEAPIVIAFGERGWACALDFRIDREVLRDVLTIFGGTR